MLGHTHHQTVASDTGIVYQNINATEIFHNLGNHVVSLLKVGGIRSIPFGFYAQGGNLLFGSLSNLVDGEVGKCDISSFRSEFQGNSFSYTPCCTRDDSNFSFQ